jgi:hypothetical protein
LDLWNYKATGIQTPQIPCHFRNIWQKTTVGTANSHVYLLLPWRAPGYLMLGISSYPDSQWEMLMLKFVILGVASLAFVGTAVAADLPRPQPQPAAAPVGKYPLGKYPVGKSPIGKYPVAAPAPVVTKG